MMTTRFLPYSLLHPIMRQLSPQQTGSCESNVSVLYETIVTSIQESSIDEDSLISIDAYIGILQHFLDMGISVYANSDNITDYWRFELMPILKPICLQFHNLVDNQRCPVCHWYYKTNVTSCYHCGFQHIASTFINIEDAEEWKNNKLIPFSRCYVPDVKWDISNGVLTSCKVLCLKSLIIPTNVKKIQAWALADVKGIRQLHIHRGVENIEAGQFHYCGQLETIVVEKENAHYKSISNCLVKDDLLVLGCNTSIIPKTVKRIEDYAFCGCTSLTHLDIHNGITQIGSMAFCSCYSMDFVLSSNVEYVGRKAFCLCDGNIYCAFEKAPVLWDNEWDLGFRGTIYWKKEWHYENNRPTPNRF